MKRRHPAEIHDFLKPMHARDSSVGAAIETLAAGGLDRDQRRKLLSDFSIDQREYIKYMAHLLEKCGSSFNQAMYIKEFIDTRQVVAMPAVDDIEFDTFAALAQPEMLYAQADFQMPKRGTDTNPLFDANPLWMFGCMTQLVMQPGAQVKGVERALRKQPTMHTMFELVETIVAGVRGVAPRPYELRDYSTVLTQLEAFSAGALRKTSNSYRLMRANVAIVRALAAMYPDAGIGKCVLIDGTDVAAWCLQTEDGHWLRNPHATLKVIERRNRDETGEPGSGSVIRKMWSGYYLVVLVELKTGLPLVWTLRPSKPGEAVGLKELLPLLYGYWPDCPAETIVGDGAWDYAKWYELCELHYGIHPVFSRSDEHADADHSHKRARAKWIRTEEHPFWHTEYLSEKVAAHDGRGRCSCRDHGLILPYVGGTWGNRDGLKPGDKAAQAGFRVRFDCPDGCGRINLPTGMDWDAFAYWPHHGADQPERYARRLALERRRNICESVFSALKTVANLGNQGAARTRLHEYDTVHTLISYAFTLRSSLMLAGERIARGEFPDAIPADMTALVPPPPVDEELAEDEPEELAA